jgi:hypothetical protein
MKRAIKRTAFFIFGISLGMAAAVAMSGCMSTWAGAAEGLGKDLRAVGAASARD